MTVICTGAQVDKLHVTAAASASEIDFIAAALKRQSSLLEEVLDLAIRALDTLQAGRLDATESLLLLREQLMNEFARAEADVAAKMAHVEENLTVAAEGLAELNDLNVQIITLANYIVAVDERANEVEEELAGHVTSSMP
jgi:hypothetical protein